MNSKIAIIGAGAAGCFAAINIKRRLPSVQVTIYESGTRPLAKVAVTGGGRCNLTNSFADVTSLETVYPRGHRIMKRLFHEFSHNDTFNWFEREGVRLVTQDDNCVFPMSQNAMEIVNLLLRRCRDFGVTIKTSCRISSLEHSGDIYIIRCKEQSFTADKVIIATGGSPRLTDFSWLNSLGLNIVPPVPSLFSFNLSDNNTGNLVNSHNCPSNNIADNNNPLAPYSGTVIEHATASLSGTKFRAQGPLLITHWGTSGPAILKLSSMAARYLAENNYSATLAINWLGEMNDNEASSLLQDLAAKNPHKQLQNIYPTALNARLWRHLLAKATLNPASRWSDIGRKQNYRLANILTNDQYFITGKNKHKEEFVTCGGISLSCLNSKTLECKTHSGLYFIGEVTDVDAITGGFNLQAAWTMAYIVSLNI